MKEVIIKSRNSEDLLQQLISLYSIFKNIEKGEKIIFNFNKVKWLNPIILLPITSYIEKTKSSFIESGDKNTNDYMNTVCFPKGIDSIIDFERLINQGKSYIPISVLRRNKGKGREQLESMFSNLIYKVLGSIDGAQNVIYHPISELITNIFDHSKEDSGFVFGQYYPNKQYLDICIADTGRGLSRAYKDEKDLELSDKESIREALKGNSTKAGKERGYGIWTSKRIVCECLGGQFIILSGSSAYVSYGKEEKLVSLPNFYWQGVIISYRIPKPQKSVNIYPYLE